MARSTRRERFSTFLAYAEKTEKLNSLFAALCVELKKVENRSRLVERAMLAPLGSLQAFLTYLEETEKLNPVFGALCAELGKDKNLPALVERALVTPLEHLQAF